MMAPILLLLLLSAPTDATLTEMIAIPLVGGRVNAGELLGPLLDRVGLDGQAVRQQVNLSIDVTGRLGGFQLDRIAEATHGVVTFETDSNSLLVRIDRLALRREERQLRARYRELMELWFPQFAAAAASRYGLRAVDLAGRRRRLAEVELSPRVVVLVHGLDEPGQIWSSLAPALLDEGFTVCEQTYPNDQGIEESARFLDVQLALLFQRGVRHVVLVAHSMGGLVSRQMLTDPMLYAGRGAGRDARPNIEVLIMIGTPNKGSALARFHPALEACETLVRALSGDGLLFGSAFDGAGEAQIDLTPDSDFLVALNARQLPEGVATTTIAGIASPIDEQKLAGLGPKFESWIPSLRELSSGLGDGCVAASSSRLEGVTDHVNVKGNHLDMLRNLPGGGERQPPAVPVVMDRLLKWRAAGVKAQ